MYANLVHELLMEDTRSYKEMVKLDVVGKFCNTQNPAFLYLSFSKNKSNQNTG